MKSIELANEIVSGNAKGEARLEAVAEKVGEVIAEVARASGVSVDEVLDAVVQRQQAQQARRGAARVKVERALLEAHADRIAKETERILAEPDDEG